MPQGTLVSIYIAAEKGGPIQEVSAVRAVPAKGLEGDRYFRKRGTWSHYSSEGREVTLIESEALEALKRDYGLELLPNHTRRNLLTRNVSLNHLVGKTFQIGPVTLQGIQLCEPCGRLDKLCGQKVLKGLTHRGGLRANIITEGVLSSGQSIEG